MHSASLKWSSPKRTSCFIVKGKLMSKVMEMNLEFNRIPNLLLFSPFSILPTEHIQLKKKKRRTFDERRHKIKFDIELCGISGLQGLYGLHFKRGNGSTWLFRSLTIHLIDRMKL